MKKKFTAAVVATFMLVLVFTANTMAEDSEVNIPITAIQAFDAVAKQLDPNTGKEARVALIDVRTTAEYFWVGACGKVESIVTIDDEEFLPSNGKVRLKWGRYLVFRVDSDHCVRPMWLPLKKVKKINTVDISFHIPTHIWDEAGCTKFANPDFKAQIESLKDDFDILILMCRSGKRSNTRDFDTKLFKKIYEIDQPNGQNGYGGFQGSSYSDVYNGYRGYPGRMTKRQESPAVSWSDAGLPVHIGWTPFSPDSPDSDEKPE